MASSPTCFFVLTFVVFLAGNVQGKLSHHDASVVKQVAKDIGTDLDIVALDSAGVEDNDIDSICNPLVSDNKIKDLLTKKGATDAQMEQLMVIACPRIAKSNKERKNTVEKYKSKYDTLSDKCRNQTRTPENLKTWLDVEEVCGKIRTGDVPAFEESCSTDEYKDLEGTVCAGIGGGAPAMFTCVTTFGLCLVASLFKIII